MPLCSVLKCLFPLVLFSCSVAAQERSSIVLQSSFPEAGGSGKAVVPVSGIFPEKFEGDLAIKSWQLRGAGDSVLLYDVVFRELELKQGAEQQLLVLEQAQQKKYINRDFTGLVETFKTVPPGRYHTELTLRVSDSVVYRKYQDQELDSSLAFGSDLRQKVNAFFGGEGLLKEAVKASKSKKDATRQQLEQSSKKLSRSLRSLQGMSSRPVVKEGKTYSELYYKDWFMGRYELAATGDLKSRAAEEQQRLQGQASSFVQSNLEDFRSVGSQLRQLYGNKKEQKGVEGSIEWNNNVSTNPDPASEQDPNYSEIYGTLSTTVLDIPVGFEGYYTTQDLQRKAKASYFRFHYDADKAKEELMELIGSYRQKYTEVLSKGKGLEQIYGSYLGRLEGEKSQLLNGFGKEYGVDGNLLSASGGSADALLEQMPALLDTAGLRARLLSRLKDSTKADSALTKLQQQYQEKRSRLETERAKIKERYEQLQALQQKSEKYRGLINQYKEGMLLDSALHYAKLDALTQNKDASYKDMAKAAAGLLPEGKVKQFTTGLTHLEAGILNRYESAYTIAGQTLKGASIGYDLGFGSVSLSGGKTEYISRSGDLDRYNSYSAGMQLKELYGQKIGLIYYSYSPTKQILEDGFFKNTDISIPTFRKPVHIGAVTWHGRIGKHFTAEAEAAVSVKQAQRQTLGMSNAALKAEGQYLIARWNTTLKGAYEHLGRDFENSAMPLSRAATERYMAGVDLSLFQSFLTLGVTWNYQVQQNFSSESSSRRWGFDIKTHSKRYPNLSLSYKPFSTFRAYDDTLSVPQRPLSGAVWTGRGSYQLKRGKRVHRFMAMYNRNSTDGGDSLSYTSATAQLGYNYSDRGNLYGAALGWMQLPGLTGTSWFVNGSAARVLGKKVSVQLGQDVGGAAYGLQRLSTTLGGSYRLERSQITLRLTGRWTGCRLAADADWQSLWAGQLGMGWQFKVKSENPR